MNISPDFCSVLEQNFSIDFTRCLPNGHLSYTDLCNVLQLTAGKHADMGGISFSDMQRAHQAWVLSRMRVEISRMPKWKDEVTVKTWIMSLENSRSVRALELYVGDEKYVGCETFWAVFNTKTRRPESLALPHDHFEKFPDRLPTQNRVKKIELTLGDEPILRKVVLSDLDIVNHVNNVKYLEWCLDLENPKIILGQKIASLDMNFMSELVWGDSVQIVRNDNHERATYGIYKLDKACYALEIGMS